MPFYSPLRYPGGKRRLTATVTRLLESNGLKDIHYAEPYAGGASVAIGLLLEEYASVVHINDLSRPVYAFWNSVINDTAELCRRVEKAKLTMEEWKQQRKIYESRESAPLDDLAFSALFLNRTNRSGIIGGGVIGGQGQTGAWGIDARFNKQEIIQRIRRISRYRSRIRLYHMDALDFTKDVVSKLGNNSFAFYDPPYIENGQGLYLNNYTIDGHRELAEHVHKLSLPWIVTYDHGAILHHLYPSCRRIVFSLNYSANGRYEGKEVMFLAGHLRLPESWNASVPIAMAREKSEYPVCGIINTVKPHPEMIEGPDAETRFVCALKTVLAVPKSAVPNPFKKSSKKKKPVARKS